MSKILVFGHQNPDTDAIASAISFAYLQNQLGKEAEAVALGAPNEETQYALQFFQVNAPRVITQASSETQEVMLVDHNERQQSVSNIANLKVLAVVDHHRIANFETADPLYYRAEPLGCTSTIIYKLFQEKKISIPSEIAGLMLSAIISDTLLFQSPTCTEEDQVIAKALAALANVELQTYGLELLKSGTNLANKSEEELLHLDAKSFPMGGQTIRIAQVNTVDFSEVLARQTALETTMAAENAANQYALFVLIITNILDSNSELLVIGDQSAKVEEAFQVTLANHRTFLENVVSRKKQIVPQLTAVFQ